MRHALVLLITIALIHPSAWSAPGGKSELGAPGPARPLTTIVFAGVAGAILGLSTLSFYGRPQDKLNNIAVGAAIGIITGAMYTTFKAATEPRDFYNLNEAPATPPLRLAERDLSEPVEQQTRGLPREAFTPKVSFQFSF